MHQHYHRHREAILVALGIIILCIAQAPIRTAAVAAAPTVTVTASALGVSLTVPRRWIREPMTRVGPGQLAFTLPLPAGRQEGSYRLLLAALGLTHLRDPMQAASAWACGLTRGLPHPIQRVRVSYGGVPGLMLRGMPGRGAHIQIVLAHRGAVYLVTAYGTILAPDQRAALASLRFVPRRGPFPLPTAQPVIRPCSHDS